MIPRGRMSSMGFAALMGLSLLPGAPAMGQCQGWLPGVGAPATSGTFRAATIFDPDGPGPLSPELVIGGSFTGLGSPITRIDYLGAWDGLAWRAFPLQFMSANGVYSLAVFDLDGDGPNPPSLIVGGNFWAGFPPNQLTNVFAANGQTVTPLSDGLNGDVNALLVFDPDGDGPAPAALYAGGSFRSSGSRSVSTVARWNGTTWEQVGTGISGSVNSLIAVDPDGPGPMPTILVAGGSLQLAVGSRAVAFFNGTTWVSPSVYPLGTVSSLSVFDFDGPGGDPPRLVAAGTFQTSNTGVVLAGQAYYNGSVWLPIDPSLQSFTSARTIGSFDPDGDGPAPAHLLLSGMINFPGGFSARLVELRNGTWQTVAGSEFGGDVYAMNELTPPGESAPTLLISGSLVRYQGNPGPYELCRWDGESLTPFQDGFNNQIVDMTATRWNGSPAVAACGWFWRAPGVGTSGVAVFNGQSWESVGAATDQASASAIISFDPDDDGPAPEAIVIGGAFDSIANIPAHNVAMFDGTRWLAMGAGIPTFPTDFALFDPDGDGPSPVRLYATGGGVSGGPGSASYIYQWDGRAWNQLPTSFVSNFGPAQTFKMAVFDPDGPGPAPRQLVLAGFFNHVGNVNADNVASFDGHEWHAMGSGIPSTNPQAVFTWDPNNDGHEVVIVAGGFTSAGGVPAHGAAVWNGTSWSALGSGFGASMSGFPEYPSGFCVFNGDLYATGYFSVRDGAPADGIVRWNGSAWEPVGMGLWAGGGNCAAVLAGSAGHGPTMCLGGTFALAGGHASAYFARYGDSPCCPADYDHDGNVNSADFFAFLGDFLNGVANADFNADGVLNSADFFEFLRAFFVGCP